ncbi:hypothetical protein VTK26DRAFT_3280 [Humicola hyalothermophila]
MKRLSIFATSLIPFSSPLLAAPAPESAAILGTSVGKGAGLAKRTPGNVYICRAPGWESECRNVWVGVNGECQPIPSPWQYNAASVGPDPGAICRLFDEAHSDCTGSGLAILSFPGNDNLLQSPDCPGYKAAFWKCNECSNCQ